MSTKIFVSHSSGDLTKLTTIRGLAAQVGVDLYFPEHDSQPGKPLADKVLIQLRSCQAFLVLLSHENAASPYVQQEIGAAIAAGLLVIPLVEPSMPRSALALLEGREYIPFDPESPAGGLTTLQAVLFRGEAAALDAAARKATADAERARVEEAERRRRAEKAAQEAQLQAAMVAAAILVVVVLIAIRGGGAGAG